MKPARTKEIIAILGPIGAGKDTAGDYIARKLHIPSFQISSPLRQLCEGSGVEPTRDNLIALGTELATKHGDGYLATHLLERVPDRAIITGIRQLGQIAVFHSQGHLTIVSIDANPTIRFERTKSSGKLGEASDLEEFIAKELAENSPPNTQRLFECMKLAHFHLTNEGSKEDLYKAIDEALSDLRYY